MAMDITLLKNWWWLTVNGIAAIIFGLVAILYPSWTLVLLMGYFGLLALFLGALFMLAGYLNRRNTRLWDFWFFEGVLNASIGLMLLFGNRVTLQVFLVLLALWAILVGAIQIISVVRMWREVTQGYLYLVNGFLAILFGIIVTINPFNDIIALTKGIGVYTIILGILSILISFSMKKLTTKGVKGNKGNKGNKDQTRIYTYHHQ